MASVLMSYITSTFQTKSDMKVAEEEWQKIIQEMSSVLSRLNPKTNCKPSLEQRKAVFMLGKICGSTKMKKLSLLAKHFFGRRKRS